MSMMLKITHLLSEEHQYLYQVFYIFRISSVFSGLCKVATVMSISQYLASAIASKPRIAGNGDRPFIYHGHHCRHIAGSFLRQIKL